MNILSLNETPVKTSNNFRINNIQLENVKLPDNFQPFDRVEVIGNAKIEDTVVSPFKYGLGQVLEENLRSYANKCTKIIPEDSSITINYTFDDKNNTLLNYLEIDASHDVDVVIKYASETSSACFANNMVKVIARCNAKVNISVVNLVNDSTNFFIAFENELQDNSNVKYTIVDLGGKNSVQNYFSNILGKSATNELETIYIGGSNEIKDINYIAELRGENSNVDILVQGALKDSAKKSFKGTIDFKKGAKKSKGDENEYCMLLSDKAKSIALPMLLCTEDDVEGNHATASGKLDDKEIFYIMSRGIERKDAIKLIVKAKFNKILEKISSEEHKNEIISEIDRRLE